MRRRKTDCGGWASYYGPCGGCDSCRPGWEDAARRELAAGSIAAALMVGVTHG